MGCVGWFVSIRLYWCDAQQHSSLIQRIQSCFLNHSSWEFCRDGVADNVYYITSAASGAMAVMDTETSFAGAIKALEETLRGICSYTGETLGRTCLIQRIQSCFF